jgi:TrmH family RNA methyltransferase
MANFGFRRLSVVAPYEESWREAKSAVQAEDVLQNARRTDSLAEAVSGCTLVAGTGTLTYRKPEQQAVLLPALGPFVLEELARGGRIALVFGSEKHGLTREDLAYCHLLVEIPTAPSQPSMNLGQAVAVCLYELAMRLDEQAGNNAAPDKPADTSISASSGELERLAGFVEDVLRAAQYSPAAMQKANRHDLTLLLRRLAINRQDAQRILGVFRRISWRLKQ